MYFINRKYIKIANPLVLYTLVWVFVYYLYSIEFTNNIVGLNYKTNILIYNSILVFFIIYFFAFFFRLFLFKKMPSNFSSIFNRNDKTRIRKFEITINKIFNIWLFFTIFEIFYFKGLPLISVVLLKQTDLNYKSFGIPSLHGLLNALYYTIVIGQLILYSLTKEKKFIKRISLLLLWPIFVMSRAVLLWVSVEIICVILIFYRLSLKRFFKIIISILFFIYIFGVIGDSRIGNASKFSTDNFVNQKFTKISESIPSGFVWVYLYATTPLNNIVVNIDNLNPNYTFKYSLSGLIPSFIYKLFFKIQDSGPMVLDNEAFNVSSFFANYLFDFGVLGTIIFVGILQLISILIYFSIYSGKLGSVIAYSAIFYAILTSIFFDNFISLITIVQIFLGFYINRLVYK